jgi:signal transduction histidine kinase
MARLSVRARLTVFVSLVFGVAVTAGAFLLFNTIENRLIDETRSDAALILARHFTAIAGGGEIATGTDPIVGSSFFFVDPSGTYLSEHDYLEKILAIRGSDGGEFSMSHTEAGGSGGPEFSVRGARIDPESGQIVGAAGEDVFIRSAPEPVGNVQVFDRGTDVVAVGQEVVFPDGDNLKIGVSRPLEPVTESLDALRSTLWYVIPILMSAVGGITWLASHRALRPVQAITTQTRAITATNLSDRVPTPVARDDVHDLATTMNDMLTRLERSQQQQRQFIADASHELRSPVAASRAQLEVGLAHIDDTDWVRTASILLAEQEHLGHLVDDLLTLSRLDEQGIGPTSPVRLDQVIAEEAERPHRNNVTVDTDRSGEVVGSRKLLARGLRNLVENADRYAESRVALTLSHDGDLLRIDVDDDGPGVPVDQREQIFDRFSRVDESRQRDRGGGTGLGLAIVRQIVELHGGDVVCNDSPLGGARFTLTFDPETSAQNRV